MQQNFKAELQAKEEELVKERDAALAETRRTLAAEQINEEKQLKAEKEKALEETRRRLQEEEDNEEAELHESKTNRIIKTKQQVCTYVLGFVGGTYVCIFVYVRMYVRTYVCGLRTHTVVIGGTKLDIHQASLLWHLLCNSSHMVTIMGFVRHTAVCLTKPVMGEMLY